jgi:L-iditol 2-dehydrogenase
MCQWMRVPARVCHPLPDNIDDAIGALLETLGVALHATDLAHIRAGASVAILGAGPIGLCITRVVAASGARDLFVADPLPWRRDVARRSAQSVTAIDNQRGEAVERIMELTGGRGVDVAIEAAWSDQSVQQAAEMLRPGGRLVIVGIPAEDRFSMIHSTARRKGLTIAFCRRMKHTYPRAIHLVNSGLVQLDDLITHRFPLQQAADGFELAGRYEPGLVKAILEI